MSQNPPSLGSPWLSFAVRHQFGWAKWRPVRYGVSDAVRHETGWGLWEPTTYPIYTEDTDPVYMVDDDLPQDTDDLELIWV